MRIFLLLLVFFSFSLSGCIKKSFSPEIKEIEFWTIQLSSFSGYINGVINEYQELRPDVRIKWVDVPYSEAEKRALAVLLSNDVPDLINMNPAFGATLASKGALRNIKPLITSQQYESYLGPAWQASSIDGFVYGVPWYITSAVTIHNKNLYSDESPAFYSDLSVIAEKIDKYVLMPALTENGKMLAMFHKYDIPIVNREKNKALFNTQKAAKVLEFWKTMYDKGYIPKESITEGHRKALEKFMAGETAFIVAGENFLRIIEENSPQVYSNIGVSRQLTGSNNKIDFALMNLVVPKKSRYPKEALDFALFITSAKNQLKFRQLVPIIPSVRGYLDEESLLSPIPALKNRKDLYEVIDYMTQEVLLGKKSSKEALNDAVMEWNKILIENNS